MLSEGIDAPLLETTASPEPASVNRLKACLAEGPRGGSDGVANPMADIFPHCTVLFSDIAYVFVGLLSLDHSNANDDSGDSRLGAH